MYGRQRRTSAREGRWRKRPCTLVYIVQKNSFRRKIFVVLEEAGGSDVWVELEL